ncbi:MAG: UDP-N-acetylmuramate--L-alanine ligase [Phycisphaerales bacterium]|jgi:UDP-N-acetylmuramate--alanine ligase
MSRLKLAGGRYHFIGAGGVGMSGLARILIGKKAIVTGSDQNNGAVTSRLNAMGAHIYTGHKAENLDPATEVVVISAAIKESNPELQLARRRGCRVFKYAQFLGELMDHFEGVAISGTHGKSTTTGWLVYTLKQIGVDPNFVVGAEVLQLDGSSGCGDTDLFVVEACEYDRSFHNFKPSVGCILNIERDHLDCYKDEADIVDSFHQFAKNIRPGGVLVANGEDPNVRKVLQLMKDNGSLIIEEPSASSASNHPSSIIHHQSVVTFGLDPRCNISARNVQQKGGFYHFDVYQDGKLLGPTRISLPGMHNVRNSLAVIAMALSIGPAAERSCVPWSEQILEALDGFKGMDRRLMLKEQHGGISVLDDYAHHPTEIRASLAAIRERYQPRRLWCVFQAHQYSRTQALLDEFAHSFAQADKVIIPEIYFARDSQASCDAVNAGILAERIRATGADVQHIATFDAVCDYLEKNVDAGDVVVTMGAGDVWKVSDEYIQRLRRNR